MSSAPPAALRRRKTGVTALLGAAHLGPALMVTLFATALAVAAVSGGGHRPAAVTAVTATVLAGQLSIGWGNDAWDAERDRVAARGDKPVAAGRVSRRTVAVAAVVALVVAVGLSPLLGMPGGPLSLLVVACGWAYNVRLKCTVASPLPYLVAFGSLPALATTSVGAGWPRPELAVAGALLGVAAHLANTVADAAADALTGVRGLPQRLGARRTLVLTAVLVAATAVLLMLRGWSRPPLLAGMVLGAAAVLMLRVGSTSRWPWRFTLAAVGLLGAGALAGPVAGTAP